jgi:hypothetical protein
VDNTPPGDRGKKPAGRAAGGHMHAASRANGAKKSGQVPPPFHPVAIRRPDPHLPTGWTSYWGAAVNR